jgi:Protein of unknown function DUF2625
LDCTPAAGQRALEALQVTTRSPLGAIAFHTGGVLIDRGWLRVLGAGCARLPRSIDGWNGLGGQRHRCPEGLLIADDALGGFFAWFDRPRTVHYFSPDTCAWEDLGLGYTDWLTAMLSEHLEGFYADLRWAGWEREVAALGGEQCLNIVPPLFLRGAPLRQRSRRALLVEEQWRLGLDLGGQLEGLPDGASVTLHLKK